MGISMKGRGQFKTSMIGGHNSNKDISVEKFIALHEDFMRDKQLENLAERTIKEHILLFKYFTIWLEQSEWFEVNQYVSKSLFIEYKEYLLFEKKYAESTINIRLRPIKTYINWLLNNEYITFNFNNYIKLVKEPEDRIHPLSKSDVKKLINAIGNANYARYRDLAISLIILDCGIRIGELLKLTIYDVDFQHKYIIVPAKVSKTRTERILPLSSRTIEMLKELKDISVDQQQEHLFLSIRGNKRIEEKDIFHNFGNYKKEAGILKKCTPYVLRHTFATEMVKKNVDIFTLQRIMGHKNITTTRQYIFLNTDDIEEKHKKAGVLDSYFS